MHQWPASASQWEPYVPKLELQTPHHMKTCPQSLWGWFSCLGLVICSRSPTNSKVKVPTPIIATAAKTAKQVTSCSLWNFEQSPCFDQDTNTSKQYLRNYRIFHRLSLETSVSTLFKFQLQRNSTMSTVLC